MPTVTEIKGDLLKITEGVIFHQVNCMGVTGGLAGALRRTFPDAFDAYLVSVKSFSCLGTAVFGKHNGIMLCHIFGQDKPGPNTDIASVRSALSMARSRLSGSEKWKNSATYFPCMMGCGLGGGNWDEYRKLIEEFFPQGIIVRKY